MYEDYPDDQAKLPEFIGELIDEKNDLSSNIDLDGTQRFEEDSLNAEIKEEIIEAVFEETDGQTNTSNLGQQLDEQLKRLNEEEIAVEGTDLAPEVKKMVDKQLKDEMFQELIESDSDEHLDANVLNETDQVFSHLIMEEEAIENLNISAEAMMKVEEKLEENMLNEPSITEVKEALVKAEVVDGKMDILDDKLAEYEDRATMMDILDYDETDKEELQEEILQDIADMFKNHHRLPEILNETKQVLNQLEQAHELVDDLEEEEVLHESGEQVKGKLEMDALEDIAEVIEDIHDGKDSNEEEIESIEELGQIESEAKIDQAIDIIDDFQHEKIQDTAELIEEVIEKENLIDHSENLTHFEKTAIDMELEMTAVDQILETKSKTHFIEEQMKNMHGNETTTEETIGSKTTIDEKDDLNKARNEEDQFTNEILSTTTIGNAGNVTMTESIQEMNKEEQTSLTTPRVIETTTSAAKTSTTRNVKQNSFTDSEVITTTVYSLPDNITVTESVQELNKDEEDLEQSLTTPKVSMTTFEALRKKRDVESNPILEKVINMSMNVLEDPNANSKEVEKAEELFEISKDLREDVDALHRSDLSQKEKQDIENMLETDAIDIAQDTIEEIVVGINEDDNKAELEDSVKDNLKTFLIRNDMERQELAQGLDIQQVEELQNVTKTEILDNLGKIHHLISNSSEQVSDIVKDEVGELFDELEEAKLDIEAANLTQIEKADIESKLDASFVNEVVDLTAVDQQEKDKFEALKTYIQSTFEEKSDIAQSETDQAFLYAKENELEERIINKTMHTFDLETISSLKKSNLKDQLGKLYDAMIQTAQISTDQGQEEKLKRELLEIYIQYAFKVFETNEEDLEDENHIEKSIMKTSTKAVALETEFTRRYFREGDQIESPDQVLLVLRNPFTLLVSMQLKQAALAANYYDADIFATDSWKSFATSGIKAWYAHTRGWLCGNVKDLSIVHYEQVVNAFDEGKKLLS